jgi:hypothetical protein
VDLQHAVERRDRVEKVVVVVGALHRDADERGNVEAEALGVGGGVVAGQDAALFELAQPLGDGRHREVDRLGQVGATGAPVALKQVQKLGVDVVYAVRHAVRRPGWFAFFAK